MKEPKETKEETQRNYEYQIDNHYEDYRREKLWDI